MSFISGQRCNRKNTSKHLKATPNVGRKCVHGSAGTAGLNALKVHYCPCLEASANCLGAKIWHQHPGCRLRAAGMSYRFSLSHRSKPTAGWQSTIPSGYPDKVAPFRLAGVQLRTHLQWCPRCSLSCICGNRLGWAAAAWHQLCSPRLHEHANARLDYASLWAADPPAPPLCRRPQLHPAAQGGAAAAA